MAELATAWGQMRLSAGGFAWPVQLKKWQTARIVPVAQVNCELIGYDTNSVDVSAGYYSYVASTPDEAEQLAKQTALRAAAEELGKQALLYKPAGIPRRRA